MTAPVSPRRADPTARRSEKKTKAQRIKAARHAGLQGRPKVPWENGTPAELLVIAEDAAEQLRNEQRDTARRLARPLGTVLELGHLRYAPVPSAPGVIRTEEDEQASRRAAEHEASLEALRRAMAELAGAEPEFNAELDRLAAEANELVSDAAAAWRRAHPHPHLLQEVRLPRVVVEPSMRDIGQVQAQAHLDRAAEDARYRAELPRLHGTGSDTADRVSDDQEQEDQA